jgi:hypothetical protein
MKLYSIKTTASEEELQLRKEVELEEKRLTAKSKRKNQK